ncbi:hypothetical protein F5050DRAFT_531070 [Lentinula boryana]|uniref:Uncharacterized protein n=1 Tax=Lentinula boryana TaxID=40481 RepID=A0ABQ8Q741_9AGAR|nr:hypothetical protein F5050DRAFT_531070 [Lentinula boryana]
MTVWFKHSLISVACVSVDADVGGSVDVDVDVDVVGGSPVGNAPRNYTDRDVDVEMAPPSVVRRPSQLLPTEKSKSKLRPKVVVDLDPLGGRPRGFQTREKSGSGGVEMDTDNGKDQVFDVNGDSVERIEFFRHPFTTAGYALPGSFPPYYPSMLYPPPPYAYGFEYPPPYLVYPGLLPYLDTGEQSSAKTNSKRLYRGEVPNHIHRSEDQGESSEREGGIEVHQQQPQKHRRKRTGAGHGRRKSIAEPGTAISDLDEVPMVDTMEEEMPPK